MKSWKKTKFRRIFNAFEKVIDGCNSKNCPFVDERKRILTDNECECGVKARELCNQLNKELKGLKL